MYNSNNAWNYNNNGNFNNNNFYNALTAVPCVNLFGRVWTREHS